MKKKRYFCDWYETMRASTIIFFSEILLLILSLMLPYHIIKSNLTVCQDYPEIEYIYLDDISTKVISNKDINISEIPETIEFTFYNDDNGNFICKYILSENYDIIYKDGEFLSKPTSRSKFENTCRNEVQLTVILSNDFEVIEKYPNFTSQSDWIKTFSNLLFMATLFSKATFVFLILSLLLLPGLKIANKISKRHKEKDTLG